MRPDALEIVCIPPPFPVSLFHIVVSYAPSSHFLPSRFSLFVSRPVIWFLSRVCHRKKREVFVEVDERSRVHEFYYKIRDKTSWYPRHIPLHGVIHGGGGVN